MPAPPENPASSENTAPSEYPVRSAAHDSVAVVGSQNAQLIAGLVRRTRVYSRVVPVDTPADELVAMAPAAVILAAESDAIDPALFPSLVDAGIPVFGMGQGFHAMATAFGGTINRTGTDQYAHTDIYPADAGTLLSGFPDALPVWAPKRDELVAAPPGFRGGAVWESGSIAAFEDTGRALAAVQWQPEVSDHGRDLLRRFLVDIAGCRQSWTTSRIVEDQIAHIRATVGRKRVLCGLSGGVDSAVCAALVQRAVGEQLTCVFVDHGLLREGEAEQVRRDFVAATGVDLHTVDAADRFLGQLAGVRDPEDKRTIIGREFIRVFEDSERDIIAGASGEPVEFLAQGTLYPDVAESATTDGGVSVKSHHNVGGLPDDVEFELLEPLRWLFKDEVRAVGEHLGLPDEMVWRHPFPGPGLAIRIIGAVDAERLSIVRRADAIARAELSAAGVEHEVWQFPVVLMADVHSVGVDDGTRTYGHPVVLRPVTSYDAMSADWARLPLDVLDRISTRITAEVDAVNRVVVDITGKPPGTIEWE